MSEEVKAAEGTIPPGQPETGAADGSQEAGGEREMTLFEHLNDLRKCLVRSVISVGVGFCICYAWSKPIFRFLMEPVIAVLPPKSTFIYTSLPEGFFTYMKVALVAGVFLAAPYIFYQIWKFVAPGLYEEERKWLIPIGGASGLFFTSGAAFGYYIVFPWAFEFFMTYADEFITPMPSLNDYLSLSLTLLFAFGIIFELPLFIFFLARLGIVNSTQLRKVRRWAILASFIVAAIVTPTPDAIGQCLMAGPLIVLYEVGIWVAYFFGKERQARAKSKETLPAPTDPQPPAPAPAGPTSAGPAPGDAAAPAAPAAQAPAGADQGAAAASPSPDSPAPGSGTSGHPGQE
jgi:sec-independent protein translocase protein TatC